MPPMTESRQNRHNTQKVKKKKERRFFLSIFPSATQRERERERKKNIMTFQCAQLLFIHIYRVYTVYIIFHLLLLFFIL